MRSRVAAHLGLKDPNYAGYIAYRWAGLVKCCSKCFRGCHLRRHSMRRPPLALPHSLADHTPEVTDARSGIRAYVQCANSLHTLQGSGQI